MRSKAGVRFITAMAIVVVGVGAAALAVARLGAGVQASRADGVPSVPAPDLPPLPDAPTLPAPPPPSDPVPTPPAPTLPSLPSVGAGPSDPGTPSDSGGPVTIVRQTPTETQSDTGSVQVAPSGRRGSRGTRAPISRVRRTAPLRTKGGAVRGTSPSTPDGAAPATAHTRRLSHAQGMRRRLEPVATPVASTPLSPAAPTSGTTTTSTDRHHKGLVARLVASRPVAEAGRGTASWDNPLVIGLIVLVAVSLGGVVKQFRDVLRYG